MEDCFERPVSAVLLLTVLLDALNGDDRREVARATL
jgi:hypothetical protein